MANGAGRLFDVMKKTGEASKGVSSKLVSLKVKSKEPLIFQIDDRLEITEEFCYFSNSADKELLNIGDIVVAVALNNGQSYYIQHNLDGLLTTVAELNFLQGATDNIQNQIDKIKTSGVATGDTLPIGSVVEFTGDQVPENWEKVEYNELIVKDVEPTTGQEVWLQKTKNLFNKKNVYNLFMAADSTSEKLENNLFCLTTGWIPCSANTYYTISGGNNRKRWQTKNKNGVITFVASSSETILTNNEACYMRCYFYLGEAEVPISSCPDVQIEEGNTATEFTPYVENKILTKNNNGKYEHFMEEDVIISPTEPVINRRKIWIKKGKNLLNIASGFSQAWYDLNNGPTYSVSNALFNYIEVNPNTIYTLSTNAVVRSLAFVFFDINKNALSIKEVLDTSRNTVTTPSNCYYVRFWVNNQEGTTITSSIISSLQIQFEQNSLRTSYEEYKDKAIYVKNNNDVYERIYSSDTIDDLISHTNYIVGSTGLAGFKGLIGYSTNLDTTPYMITISSVNPTGYPSGLGGNSCIVITSNSNNSYRGQLAFGFGADKIAMRRCFGSTTWTAWKYVSLS